MNQEIYLDNHATTRVDPRVIDAMLPALGEAYANAGSVTHEPGRRVAAMVDVCRDRIRDHLHGEDGDLIFTSGATESINLALFGVANHPKLKRRKMVSACTEHRAALDPIARLEKQGWEVAWLNVEPHDRERAGLLRREGLLDAIDDRTAMVSLMLGNNEIGTIEDFASIAERCREVGAVLHIDATQSIGKLHVDVEQLGVDLLSFSAHKFYGPKGVGGLWIRNASPPLRLIPQIVGGGQQLNLRSGTLNSPGIIGMDAALSLCMQEREGITMHCETLRNRLWDRLRCGIPEIRLNGPSWSTGEKVRLRLPGNLNVRFPRVDGQSLMLQLPEIAVSSGSACTSSDPHPSHVLRGMGLSEDEARASIRFGIGKYNTVEEIDYVADRFVEAYASLATFVT